MKAIKVLLLLFLPILSTASLSDTTTITYFHQDMLGSPVAASSETGAVLWRKEYQPLGKTVDADGTNHIGYTGHVEDKSTGLSYMQQRYYDPEIGRFYSNDPVGVFESVEDNPMMFNRYAYANNNPYLYTDPDGRQSLGVYVGARLSGKSHEEATRIMMDSTNTVAEASVEAMSYTKGGAIIDVVETTHELITEEDIKDNIADMTAGEIAGAVTEKLAEKKLGKEGSEVAGDVVGKFAGDAAKKVTSTIVEQNPSVEPGKREDSKQEDDTNEDK